MSGSIAISVRFEPDLYKLLRTIAFFEDESANQVINRAVKQYVIKMIESTEFQRQVKLFSAQLEGVMGIDGQATEIPEQGGGL